MSELDIREKVRLLPHQPGVYQFLDFSGRIIYIGKANAGRTGRRGLRKRLDEFRRSGAGQPVGHSGGRRIWQLSDHAQLRVGWQVTDDTAAAATETALIAQFHAHHGRRPFANMRN